MKRKIIITNEHFKNSNGYQHTRDNQTCPLALAMNDDSLYIGGSYVSNKTTHEFLYNIPFREWNRSIVDPIIERAKAGEIVPDFELELEVWTREMAK